MPILYSTDCPKCRILKAKLKEVGFEYKESNSIDDMERLGICQVPQLEIDGRLLDFNHAMDFLQTV